MKHQNLRTLADHGFRVPKFIVVRNSDETDLSFSDCETFAVRSSFSGEDGADSSFAGQFDSFLNVPRRDVADAVEKVLQSARKENVSAYLKARALDEDTSMHVIIQEMVDADYSGVVFTANPVGILNETVIVVGAGLGSGVVEDKVHTTAYYYNQDDGIYDCRQQENAPLLEEGLLRELIDGAKEVREIFSYETDIEFAIRDGLIYYLQARPITTLNTANPIILDNSNIVESYPGISLPLTQDFVKSVYHGVFYSCILRISNNQKLTDRLDPQLRDMTDVANWRIYYRISNWYALLKMLPFSGKLIPIWQNMLGVGNRFVSAPDGIRIRAGEKLTILWRFVSHLWRTPKLMEKLNTRFAESYPHYQRQVEDSDDPEALLRVYADIRESILRDWDLTLINDLYTFICTALAGKRNSTKVSDIKNLESMKPSLAINELVETAKHYGLDSAQYRVAAQEYIAAYGDRCLNELKLETKTYRTDPALLDAAVQKRMAEGSVYRHAEVEALKSRNFFVNRAKIGIRNREISRLNRSRIYGLSRAIFLKIGAYYAQMGQLETARDVFYLRMEELRGDCDRKALVLSRKQEQLQYENTPPYSRLVFAEKVINKPADGSQSQLLDNPDTMTGIGTSVGKITGRVLVIDQPDDQIDTTGKILVARSTDPGWVFLLQRAKGIIAEKGSLLSHTAIISRELHKPAVVNVKDCTRLLRSGDLVELDADEGRITVMERCKTGEHI